MTLVTYACYVLMWGILWLPVILFHNTAVLFLYQIALLLWLVLEGIALIAFVLGIVSLRKIPRRTPWRRRVMGCVIAAGTFLLLSLPVLWTGGGLITWQVLLPEMSHTPGPIPY